MKKRISILLLVLLLCCACAPKTAGLPDATPTLAPTAEPAPTLDQDLIILYTNDVHCGVNEGGGYAGLSELSNPFPPTAATWCWWTRGTQYRANRLAP